MKTFKLDKSHSSVEFSVKHMMVSTVKGRFTEFDGEISGDLEDLSTLQVKGIAYVDSIETKNADRDNHLRSADFFDVEKFPEIEFVSKSVTDNTITGDLKIKDEVHEETFEFEHNGVHKNPFTDSYVTGVILRGTINREKYGLTWNQALETGGVMVGKDVKIEIGAEFEIAE
ncbi:YceI family protein [Nosocomiicoccus sp. HMSC09A07]|uniref:YceI family protein n=1 Tax=Nosocomiicoccus sp. HMSC09A07 TaxID=1581145 RepID=UPI0008A1C4D3|nr:YceI family protein [Nosocomiicoccus sp. HMSC09A07]OFS63116.1 hypothetical protein HMPREF3177_04245 [Nosocomiicoccus sp. HMSC09A07]